MHVLLGKSVKPLGDKNESFVEQHAKVLLAYLAFLLSQVFAALPT